MPMLGTPIIGCRGRLQSRLTVRPSGRTSPAMNARSVGRGLLVGPALALTGLLTACGFIFSHAPPVGHEQMSSFSCTESNAGPILDIVWGGLNFLGALQAASDPGAYANSDQIMAVGFSWTVVSSVAAAVGFDKSKKCRAARAQLAARQQGTPGLVPSVHVGDPAEVVVSPAVDTLRVGERVQLLAVAHESSGAALTGRAFFWTSSNDAIASVSGAGSVVANAPGSVVIAARTGNVVGTARIVIVGP